MNGEKEDGPALLKEHGVIGYPTLLVLNPQGKVVGRWYGYSKSLFLDRTASTLADLTPFEEKIARFDRDPTEGGAATLARYQESRGEYREALRYYGEANRLAGTPKSDYLMGAFESTAEGVDRGDITFPELTASADALFGSPAVPAEELIYPARAMVSAARDAGKLEVALPYLKQAEERTRDVTDPDAVTQRKKLLPDYALLVLKKPEEAVAYKKAAQPEGWMEEAGGLNGFAWWCFENNVNLEEAERLAEKGVALAAPGTEKAQILDTLAEICNARGNCGEALKLIEQAINEDPKGKHYQEQKKRFEALVTEQKHKG